MSVSTASSRAGSSDDSTVGVNTAALTRWSCSNAVNASPAYASGGATTNAAPDSDRQQQFTDRYIEGRCGHHQ